MDSILYKCFKKVRVGTPQLYDKEVNTLLSVQTKLRTELSENPCAEVEKNLSDIEKSISEKISKRNADCVSDLVQSLSVEGKFSQIGMWKLKSKLIPQGKDPPMGKYDEHGNLVTAPEALKALYLNHYKKRLRHRKIKAQYLEKGDCNKVSCYPETLVF